MYDRYSGLSFSPSDCSIQKTAFLEFKLELYDCLLFSVLVVLVGRLTSAMKQVRCTIKYQCTTGMVHQEHDDMGQLVIKITCSM